VTEFQIIFAIGGIVVPIIVALLLLVNKMHNGRVDALDRREHDNNERHLHNHEKLQKVIAEERRIAEERDTRIFDKLDKATEKISELNANIVGGFVSKEDCGRCKGE
jgi:hypothetical protein